MTDQQPNRKRLSPGRTPQYGATMKQTVSGMFFMARGGKIIKLRGIRCGTGSDGEPVVLPIA